jgi:hypothetical protein
MAVTFSGTGFRVARAGCRVLDPIVRQVQRNALPRKAQKALEPFDKRTDGALRLLANVHSEPPAHLDCPPYVAAAFDWVDKPLLIVEGRRR